jgi:NADPH:quinone reductase-like Zn-dependent oxidoreductase
VCLLTCCRRQGSAAVQLGARLGCEVIALTSNPEKAGYLRSLGAAGVVVAPRDNGGGNARQQSAWAKDPLLKVILVNLTNCAMFCVF